MITIHNLEIQFDVEGGDEDEVFKQKFASCIGHWSRESETERMRIQQMQRERSLYRDVSEGMDQ
jgi:hypothetical protein